jgi:hypothetical protein
MPWLGIWSGWRRRKTRTNPEIILSTRFMGFFALLLHLNKK